MRLATVIAEGESTSLAAVSVDPNRFVGLHAFLTFFGLRNLPDKPTAALEEFLPGLMPRLSELTRKLSDWPEHEVVFQKRGGISFKARKLLSPILRPPTFRDFYGFEQHARTVRGRRGLDMPQAWYEIAAFYFSNPNSLIGTDAEVFAPAGSKELDYELEIGVVIGKPARDISRNRPGSVSPVL